MALQYIIENKEDIPESFVDKYKETEEGKFRLDIEGVKSLDEYKEVYDASEGFKSEIEQLKSIVASYGEYTPDKITEIEGELQIALGKVDDASDPTEIQKKAEQIAEFTTKELKKQINEKDSINAKLTQENADLKQSIQMGDMRTKLQELTKGEINEYSFEDIVLRAKADGIIYREDKKDFYHSASAMSLEQWTKKILENNPHYKKWSESAGARGGNGNGKSNKPLDLKSIVDSFVNVQ